MAMVQTKIVYKGQSTAHRSSFDATRHVLACLVNDYRDKWPDVEKAVPRVKDWDIQKYAPSKLAPMVHRICKVLGLRYGHDVKFQCPTAHHTSASGVKFPRTQMGVYSIHKTSAPEHPRIKKTRVCVTLTEDADLESLKEDVITAQNRLARAQRRATLKKALGLSEDGLDAVLQDMLKK